MYNINMSGTPDIPISEVPSSRKVLKIKAFQSDLGPEKRIRTERNFVGWTMQLHLGDSGDATVLLNHLPNPYTNLEVQEIRRLHANAAVLAQQGKTAKEIRGVIRSLVSRLGRESPHAPAAGESMEAD